jgi:hypothetical protein
LYEKEFSFAKKLFLNQTKQNHHSIYIYIYIYTGLFISPSGISELDCATTKTDTAERSISIDRKSLQVFFTRRRGVLAGFTARGAVVTKHGVDRE